MKSIFKRLSNDTHGGTAIEYGLVLALLFIAIVGAIDGFADANEEIWTDVSSSMSEAVKQGTSG